MKAISFLLTGLLFSSLPGVYVDEPDLVEQLINQTKPILSWKTSILDLNLKLETLEKDKLEVLSKLSQIKIEEPTLDKPWELLKIEDYESKPVLNKVWEKLQIGEFESEKDFLVRKEGVRVKAQKEFDLLIDEWKSKKATEKRFSDLENKKNLLKEKATKEYTEKMVSWKSKLKEENKRLEQFEKSIKDINADLKEKKSKISSPNDTVSFNLIYKADHVKLPKFNREKMAFELELSTGIVEDNYGLIQSKKDRNLFVKIWQLNKYKASQYEIRFKTLDEAKRFKELFESEKVFIEQKFILRQASIPFNSPAYFEPRKILQHEKTELVDIQVDKSLARSTTEIIGVGLLYSIFGAQPPTNSDLIIPRTKTEKKMVVVQKEIVQPEIKVDGTSYNFEVSECKAVISSSAADNSLLAEVIMVSSKSTSSNNPHSYNALLGEAIMVSSKSTSSNNPHSNQSNIISAVKQDFSKVVLDIEKNLVLIPAGKFMMGSIGSKNIRVGETRHEVTLTKPFYISKYEVTQEQWESLMGNNPSRTKGSKLPVTDVSWEDCQDFIKKLNAKTNGGYRLPREAEWEYACRAGTTTAYSFGDNLTEDDANVKGTIIKVVGSYKPNAFGLYDMHGNVWEWCEDWYDSFQDDKAMNPIGPVTGTDRVLRGGSFNGFISLARSSVRLNSSPTNRDYDVGLRLAKTP